MFLKDVEKQYHKKFGRFGEAVVSSNMKVMSEGFARVTEIKVGELTAKDRSSMCNPLQPPLVKRSHRHGRLRCLRL